MENLRSGTENLEIKTNVLTGQKLVDKIYQGQSLPQDKRFISFDDGGVFKYFQLSNIVGFSAHSREKKFYPIVELNDLVVGLSELEQDPNNPTNFWIKFISVDPQYQGNGYARKIIEKIFDFVKENNYSLEPSVYSLEGEEKLKKIINETAEKSGVKLVGPHV
jgi:GNAT superfamily N-acetyltransferase